jgi:hypothetical protein
MTGYRHDAGLPRVSEVPVRPIRPLQAPPIGFQQPDDFADLAIKRSRMYSEKR